MIKRSQRRSPSPSVDETLSVHLNMARARQWQRRLWLSSASACAVSLLLWLVGAGLLAHLVVTATAFVLSLALPVRSARDWALAWVSGHGLSYPTALELAQSPDDPYGFHAAVTKRASAQAARLEPPKQQPWWLPLLVTAVVLAVVPVGPFGGRGAPFAVTRPNITAATGTETGAAPAPTAAPEDPQDSPDPLTAEAADTSATAPSLNDLSATGNTEAGAEGGSNSDAEALDRFLDTLRDQPPRDQPTQGEQQTNPFSSAAPSQRSGTPGERETSDGRSGEGQDNPSGTEPSSADQQGEQGQEQGQGEQGQGDPGQAEQSREQGQGEQSQGEPGQEGEEQGQGDPGQAEGQGEQKQPTDQEGAGESDAQNAQQGDAAGSPQQGAPGDEAGTPEVGESGEGAGDTPGGATLRESNRLDTSGQDPEQLQGRLNGGPSNVAGTVRLQSTPPESQLPGGSAPGGFSRAEEQAITEGRIPVEYQDIIRNYFR